MTDRSPSGREPPGDQARPSADENRALTNIVLVAGFLVLVGCGIWIVGAMLDARRADECMGRRNCSELPITPQRLR